MRYYFPSVVHCWDMVLHEQEKVKGEIDKKPKEKEKEEKEKRERCAPEPCVEDGWQTCLYCYNHLLFCTHDGDRFGLRHPEFALHCAQTLFPMEQRRHRGFSGEIILFGLSRTTVLFLSFLGEF